MHSILFFSAEYQSCRALRVTCGERREVLMHHEERQFCLGLPDVSRVRGGERFSSNQFRNCIIWIIVINRIWCDEFVFDEYCGGDRAMAENVDTNSN